MNIVVIGADAAGMSVASKVRRSKPDAVVTVFEKTNETSYGACGLPYFISGLNQEAEKLRIRKPAAFLASGIDLRMGWEVVAVDAAAQCVTAREVATGATITAPYDELVCASGAAPILPPVAGREKAGVFVLKSIADAEAIRTWALREEVQDVVVVGGGYIGLELCESFVRLGKRVSVIEMAARPMLVMDEEFSALISSELMRAGVALHLEEGVTAVTGERFATGVVTNKGTYPADLVVLCVGVRPNTAYLDGTGVARLPNGAVIVDRQMATNVPHIYAAGDCATVKNRLTGQDVYLPLGTNANKQGKILGEILTGRDTALAGVLGSSMCRIVDIEVGRTGLNERDCAHAGIPAKSVLTTAHTKPPYYPGGCELTVKIIYHAESHALLGVQMVGQEGAASRVGMCAVAIQAGMTCEELAMADLGYAPPFTYVWDPVQLAAGMVK